MKRPAALGQYMRDAFGRSVRSMRGCKCVVHVEVAERRQRPGERGIVALFAGMEADVFEQQHVAVAHLRDCAFGIRTDAVVRERHRNAEPLGERRRDRGQRILRGSTLPSGRPRCESTIVRAPRSCSQRNVGNSGVDASVVGDRAAVDRYVEILTNQYAFSANVEILNRGKITGCLLRSAVAGSVARTFAVSSASRHE